ncbi:sel1 repeat family protein [Azospirillum sp. B4]|uniref:sel1 repeat family protein n=1 Tax=Azospirillum sp. B4 TaxID=95605 RepID=UPI00034A8363|nr:sel1 repeat family protein [Azospirillum sp. B4]
MAVYYYYGRGTAKDPQRAAEVVKPAAEAGLGMAALIYGQLHNTGAIPGGADEAQYWYNVARRAGCAPCVSSHQEFLNSIEAKLNLPASKGQGDLISDPIVLQGVADDAAGVKREYTVLGILYPGWKRVEQRLLTENGRRYDQLTLENSHQRRVHVYFDVTDWLDPARKAPGAKS